jgi:hypothetical protein
MVEVVKYNVGEVITGGARMVTLGAELGLEVNIFFSWIL